MPQQPTKAQQRAMHRKHVFLYRADPGKPTFWGNYYSTYWYATKDIPYTEWKGDTHDFQEYLWDVRTLRGYDKETDQQFALKAANGHYLVSEFRKLLEQQRAYHYSVLCAAEIEASNGVRQLALATSREAAA
jgi:hypothetical protein